MSRTTQGTRRRRALLAAPHLLLGAVIVGLLCASVVPLGVPIAAAAALLGLGAAVAGLRRGRAGLAFGCLLVVLLGAGWGWGTARLDATRPPPVPAGGADVAGTFDVVATSSSTSRGMTTRMTAVRARGLDGAGLQPGVTLIVEFDERHRGVVGLGRRVRVSGRLGPLAGSDSPDWWRAYVLRQGLSGRLRARWIAPAGDQPGLPGLRNRMRAGVMSLAGAGSDGVRAAVVRSMALGDASGLTEADVERFRDAGIWHLMVVSGHNVTMIALAVLTFLGALGVRRTWATAVAIMLVTAYCLVCDGGASVARAGTMGVIGLLAQLRSSRRDRWYLVLAGLAGILLIQPRAIGDPGLQLSFSAVAGMLAVTGPLWRWSEHLRGKPVVRNVALGLVATLATTPVIIWHFQEVSLAGLAANLIAVPLAGPVVIAAMASIGLLPLSTPVGTAIGAAAGWGAGVIVFVADGFAGLPFATTAPPRWAGPIVAAVCIGVIVGARRLGSARGTAISRLPSRQTVVASIAVATTTIVVAMPGPRPVAAWPAAPAVSVLDVGQGDAVLLRSPEGGAVLIDTGPAGEPAPVIGALRRAGVRRLDVLAVTHDQADHSGAAAAVMDTLEVARFATPVAIPAVERAAAERGVPVTTILAGDLLRVGDWRLEVLWPRPGDPAPEDPNDASLVLDASARGLRVLLTGDAEGGVLRRLRLGDVDVLKVSHHGSADPDLAEVLRRIGPEVGLISAGHGNRFGHPTTETLVDLGAAGIVVGRTDRSGTVTVIPGPAGPIVSAERGAEELGVPPGPR